jgi:alpha-1,2-mannosyltransferase
LPASLPKQCSARLGSTAAIALACAVCTAVFTAFTTVVPPLDLRTYRAIGWAMLHGIDPYGTVPGTALAFVYTPFAAWLFTPLALFPPLAPIRWQFFALLWSFASLALLAWTIRRTLLLAPGWAAPPNGARTTAAVIASVALAIAGGPISDHLGFGQINIALMAVCFYDFVGPRNRSRRIPQGVLIGLAAAVKLTPAIFVIYLLLTRRLRAAGVAIASAIAVTTAAAVVSAHASRVYFLGLIWHLESRVSMENPETIGNQSLKGALVRLVPDQLVSPLWVAAVLVAGIGGLWLSRMAWQRRGDIAGACTAGLVAVIVSPVSWIHHLVWLIPSAVLLGFSTLPRDRMVAIAAVLLTLARTPRLGEMWSRHAGSWLADAAAMILQDSYLLLAVGIVLWLGLSAPAQAVERRAPMAARPASPA